MTTVAVERVADIVGQQLFGVGQQASAQQDLFAIGVIWNIGNVRRSQLNRSGRLRLTLRSGELPPLGKGSPEFGHLFGGNGTSRVAPGGSNVSDDRGDFVVVQCFESGHGECIGTSGRSWPASTAQDNMDQRSGVGGIDHVVTRQGRKYARHAASVGSVAGHAVFFVRGACIAAFVWRRREPYGVPPATTGSAARAGSDFR